MLQVLRAGSFNLSSQIAQRCDLMGFAHDPTDLYNPYNLPYENTAVTSQTRDRGVWDHSCESQL